LGEAAGKPQSVFIVAVHTMIGAPRPSSSDIQSLCYTALSCKLYQQTHKHYNVQLNVLTIGNNPAH